MRWPALRRPGWRALAGDTLWAVAVVAGVTVLIGATESVGHVSTISDLYVIAVAVLATRRRVYAAVVASVLAFVAYDWFFVPPVHRFTVNDPSEYLALLTLLVTTVVIGQLLGALRQQAAQAQGRQRQTQLLYEVSREALSSPHMPAVYPLALWRLNETLGLAGSRLLVKDGKALRPVAAAGTLAESDGPEEAAWLRRVVDEGQTLAVRWQARNNVRVVEELDLAAQEVPPPEDGQLYQLYLPLRIESRVEGVLVVGEKEAGALRPDEDRRLLLAFSNQLALALERQGFAEQEARARALEESDRLKSALVSSVSHELKTPLAAIKASATSLLEDAAGTDAEARRELAESINRETDRLTRLVGNLLDMSRLEAGALQPQLEWVSIADVLAEVLDRLEPLLEGRRVTVAVPPDAPPTPLDFVQISQVVTNLLENAVRYSPPGAAISVAAEVVRDQLRVTVFNEGSHIAPGDLERLFEKFYRLGPAPDGIGLGLSIARGMVEAHQGRIWAENVGRRGVAFTFTLPSPPPPQPATPPPPMSVVA